MKCTKQTPGVGRYMKRREPERRNTPFPEYERDTTPDLVDIMNGARPCQEASEGGTIRCQRCGHVNQVSDLMDGYETECICESCGESTTDYDRTTMSGR